MAEHEEVAPASLDDLSVESQFRDNPIARQIVLDLESRDDPAREARDLAARLLDEADLLAENADLALALSTAIQAVGLDVWTSDQSDRSSLHEASRDLSRETVSLWLNRWEASLPYAVSGAYDDASVLLNPDRDCDSRAVRDALLRLSAWADGPQAAPTGRHRQALRRLAERSPQVRERAKREGVEPWVAARRHFVALGVVRVVDRASVERRVRFGRTNYVRNRDGEILDLEFWDLTLPEGREHLAARARTAAKGLIEEYLTDTGSRFDQEAPDDDPLAGAWSLERPPPGADRSLLELLNVEQQSAAALLAEDRWSLLLALSDQRGDRFAFTDRREEIAREWLRQATDAHGENITEAEIDRRVADALGVKQVTVRQTRLRLRGD